MTAYYQIVIETETSGAVSAYVPGLPVYAAADSRAKAERGVRETLAAYLNDHPATSPTAKIRVARVAVGNQPSRLVAPEAHYLSARLFAFLRKPSRLAECRLKRLQ